MKNQHNLHIIGIGGAGTNTAAYFHKQGVNAKYTYINNLEINEISKEFNYINFVSPTKEFIQTKKYQVVFSDMTQELIIPQETLDLFTKNEKYLLLSGLGGYTGTFMMQQLTEMLYQQKIPFLSICTSPFNFEGEEKNKYALQTTQKLQHISNFHCINLENVLKNHGNLSVKESFEKINEMSFKIFQSAQFLHENDI